MVNQIFPGEYKSLSEISEFVVNQANYLGFSSKDIYSIQIAVDEACSNIIDHAYGKEDLGYIELQVEDIENGMKITIRDDGDPFDPEEIPDPVIDSPLEERRERGLGLYIMRKLMDEVTYDFSSPNQNKLIMVKRKSGV
jgi:serine/threonine-protein kinase RsbW